MSELKVSIFVADIPTMRLQLSDEEKDFLKASIKSTYWGLAFSVLVSFALLWIFGAPGWTYMFAFYFDYHVFQMAVRFQIAIAGNDLILARIEKVEAEISSTRNGEAA